MCSVNKTELTDELRNVHAGCSLTIAVLGTLGNAMSVSLICKARLYKASPIMMLILDLCVSNALSTTIILPIITATSIYRQWVFGKVFCKAFGYLMYVTLMAECLILTNLTVCQYLTIVHQVSIKAFTLNRHTHLRLFALVGLPWVIAILVFLVPLTDTWDTFGYEYKTGYCSLIKVDRGIGFKTILAFAVICIMTAVTFYCYSAILIIYMKSRRRIQQGHQSQAPKFQGYTKKILLMISAILINYIVTYLPFLVSSTVDPCRGHTSLPVHTVMIYVSWSHSAINPVIYALLNRKIKVLWCNTLHSLPSISRFTSKNTSDERRGTEPG
ncbi:unnamed protein product [Candidula unifasciata]|uniref:G-protein coupled receptors family 1 profile domain-containing protein n=1 Tax=Candidula unifasciata TaxID=100452 RepID=A0A8S3YNZ1_9EUPU|nr:unnamed protein product [Candidula unifasciata]